jgi:hypothetical protein
MGYRTAAKGHFWVCGQISIMQVHKSRVERPHQEGAMKISATIISICLTLFLLCVSCSREEPALPPIQKTKVRRPITMPPPEKAETSITGGEEIAESEVKEFGEVKTASVEERALKTAETEAGEKDREMEEVIGYYIAKKGESLSSIAAREDVYGDPLKWPILYRLNIDKLGKLQLGEGLPHREVPEGLRLRILSPHEIRENLARIAHNVWAVSVLSGTTDREIVPPAIRLIKNRYPVYITSVKVKEKDWMRLRVGFFKNRTVADQERKKIMSMLNCHDSWVTKVGKPEVEEFGGYY